MATATEPIFDPYAEKPSFFKTHSQGVAAVAAFVITVVLTVFSTPPYRASEVAYVCVVPGLYWAYFRPRFWVYFATMAGASAVAWTLLLGWLHHVTWGGLLLLGPIIGIWIALWYIAVWWTMPRMIAAQNGTRILAMFGLAALWVIIEWTRTWVLSGFPWMPLSATQWQRAAVLQIAAYTGASGISFLLVAFNVGFAAYGHRLMQEKHQGLRKRSPEFMAALMCLILTTFYLIYADLQGQERQPFARIAVVQPDIPQTLKWDPSQSDFIFNTLGGVTAKAARTWPDLILWPEASTPHAVKGDLRIQHWVEELVQTCGVPLLIGSISYETDESGEVWQNAAFAVDPKGGLNPEGYAKQHLVPFGEYIPLRPILGWLEKFVPIGGDFVPGQSSAPVVIPTATKVLTVGPLICYEDIFPAIARESAAAGAEILAVLTNSAWYGKGAAAYQHAAHSVLRAVEVRRPVIRCGNNGWSGWIDEFGTIRDWMRDEEGSVYLRGTKTFEITRDARWEGRQSFYTQHGDWFVLLCAGLATFAYFALVLNRTPATPPPDTEDAGAV